jgi:hypothetical protein
MFARKHSFTTAIFFLYRDLKPNELYSPKLNQIRKKLLKNTQGQAKSQCLALTTILLNDTTSFQVNGKKMPNLSTQAVPSTIALAVKSAIKPQTIYILTNCMGLGKSHTSRTIFYKSPNCKLRKGLQLAAQIKG